MSERFPSPENIPVTKDEVVTALDAYGPEDQEARALLIKYEDQCRAEADREAAAQSESAEVSDRANIICAIKMAELYLATENYKHFGEEALEQAWEAASQNKERNKDLLEQIESLFKTLP